jgi:hypothetical protein
VQVRLRNPRAACRGELQEALHLVDLGLLRVVQVAREAAEFLALAAILHQRAQFQCLLMVDDHVRQEREIRGGVRARDARIGRSAVIMRGLRRRRGTRAQRERQRRHREPAPPHHFAGAEECGLVRLDE